MSPQQSRSRAARVFNPTQQVRAEYAGRLMRWVEARLPPDSEARAKSLAAAVLDREPAGGEARAFSSEGAFMVHLRDELASMVEVAPDSRLGRAAGAAEVRRYERALRRLPEAERQAIVGRLELCLAYDELAGKLEGLPDNCTIQTFVARAVLNLAAEMAHSEALYAGR